MKKIKILIVDDQRLMREALKTILNLEEDMEVVALAKDGQEAYELCKDVKPNVVLMDVQMPVMDGVKSTERIKSEFPEIIVIMLTTFDEEDYIIEALSNGASGFLLKDIPGNKLIETIRDAIKGQLMLPSNIAIKLATSISKMRNQINAQFQLPSIKHNFQDFSDREREVIGYMIRGFSNKQISERLFISEGTARNYVSVIYNKIGINDRAKSILYLKELFEA